MPNKKELLANVLRYSGAGRMLRAVGSWRGVLALNYHRIGDPLATPFDRGVISGTAEQFETQLRTLARHCDIIGIKDLERAILDRRGRYALLTFDDGYRDNYAAAFPVLMSLRLPAVFFVTTGFLDDRRVAWWDDIAWMVRRGDAAVLPESRWTGAPIPIDRPHGERAIHKLLSIYKQLPVGATEPFLQFVADTIGAGRCPAAEVESLWMTWEMVREMRRGGMDIGGHTVTHPVLARLTPEAQWQEIARSKQRIEAELDEPIDAFSYPVGQLDSFTPVTKDLLSRVGYRYGFSFHGGFSTAGQWDPYDIPRYPVSPELSVARLQALCTLPQVYTVK